MNQMKNDWTRQRFLQTAGTLSALAGTQAKTVAAVTHRGVSLFRCERVAQANAGDLCIVAAGSSALAAMEILQSAKVTVSPAPESLAVAWGTSGEAHEVLTCPSRRSL